MKKQTESKRVSSFGASVLQAVHTESDDSSMIETLVNIEREIAREAVDSKSQKSDNMFT